MKHLLTAIVYLGTLGLPFVINAAPAAHTIALPLIASAATTAAATSTYTTSATTSASSLAAGASVTLNALVQTNAATKLLVDLEVYQPDGQRVFQQAWDNQSLTANQQRTFSVTWQVPSTAAAGAYILKIGLFAPGWASMYAWNNAAGKFSVTSPTSSGRYFSTLPPGAALPSDATCAAAVKRKPENKRANAAANATRGSQQLPANFLNGAAPNLVARVSGNFTGTTDEILQWAACKWGVDEDMVRAQAAAESWWLQSALGDWSTDATVCAPGHGLGADGKAGQCPGSWGILQNRYAYERAAWPGINSSTAFNADTAYMIWRACYEGYETWLNTVERGKQYAAGDAYGCMGRWFAGRWYTAPATDYINRVNANVTARVWEQPNFQQP